MWITGLHRKCSEANTSQNDLAGNALEKKRDTNEAMKCDVKLQLADKQAVLRLFIDKGQCKIHRQCVSKVSQVIDAVVDSWQMCHNLSPVSQKV